MADATLIVNGSTPIHLEPDIIYRIGRGAGVEIPIADQSMELAHATACILRRGVVRFASALGRIFVNGEEKTLTDVGKEDAFNGKDVKLRFGNVEAILEFKDDVDGHNTSSGFGECVQDKNDLTGDSFEIPETQPPPEDTSVNVTADSFYIPETQAVVSNRPSTGGNISLGEDFMIPETQVVPLMEHNESTRCSEGSSSGSGSHIRICTQDFNDDAIDDFDSSLILGHPLMPLSPPKADKRVENPETTRENPEASELEMSALNWSVSNSKCTALNSTNHQNEGHSGLEACLTPTLTGLSQDIQTPDLLDSILGDKVKGNESNARQEEPAIPSPDLLDSSLDEARLSGSTSNASTSQLCGVQHLVVATIETPRPTPDEKEDNTNKEPNQDLIATQRFPGRKLIESDEEDEPVKEPNQDFIATQRFPGRKLTESNEEDEPNREKNTVKELNQDFIATQRFPGRKLTESDEEDQPTQENKTTREPNQDFIATQRFPGRKLTESDKADEPNRENSRVKELNQDFIATQRFPGRNLGESDEEDQPTQENNTTKEPNQDFIATQRFPGLNSKESDDKDQPNQDFVPTQLFIPPPQSGKNQKLPECFNKNLSLNQDFIETQVFPGRGSAIQNKENISSDNVSLKDDSSNGFKDLEPILDEIDEVLNEMIAGTRMSPVDPNEEQIKYFKPCVIKDQHHDQKVSQIEGVFTDVSNQSRWRNETTNEVNRKRVARSVSPQATPGHKNRRLSEGSEWLELTPKRHIFNELSEPSIAETEENTVEINTNSSPQAEKETTKAVGQINKTSPIKSDSEEPEETGVAKKEQSGRRRKCTSSSSDELDIKKPKRAKESSISEEPKMEKKNTLQKSTTQKGRSRAKSKAKSSEPEVKEAPRRRSGGRSKAISEEPSGDGTNVQKSRSRAKSKAKSSEPEVKEAPKGRSKAISEEPSKGDVTNVPKRRSRAKSKAKSSEPEVKEAPRRGSGGRSKAISKEPSEGDGPNVPISGSRAKSKAKSSEPEVKEAPRRRSGARSKAIAVELKDISNKVQEPIKGNVTNVPKSRSRAKSKSKSSEPEVKEAPRRRSGGRSKAISQEPSEGDGTNVPKSGSRAKSKAKSSEPEVKEAPKGRSKAISEEPSEGDGTNVPKSRSRAKSKAKSSEPEVKEAPRRRSGGRSKAIAKDLNDISNKVQEPSEGDVTNVPKSRSRARSKAVVGESVKKEPPKRRNARSSSAKKSLDSSKTSSEMEPSEDGANNKPKATKVGARKGSAAPSSNKGEAIVDKKPKRGRPAAKPKEPVTEKDKTQLKSTSEPIEAEVVEKPSKKDEEVGTKPPPRAPSMRLSMTPPDSLRAITQYIKQVRLDGKIKIVFSMCDRKPLERVLKSLQKVIEVTEDPLKCDLVIMDHGDRTYKFLVGVASNKPILSSSWLHSVRATSCISVKDDHLFQDESFEEKFKFRPISVLEGPRLLHGLTFFLRDGIQPSVKEMQAIIECAGGNAYLKRPPLSTIGDIFVVTTPQDWTSKNIMRDFAKVHFIKPEGIMQALLQHKQELVKNFPIEFES
nr:titin [Drosophila bipectinata]